MSLAPPRKPPPSIAVRLALLIYLAADLVLVLGRWTYGETALMLALAVPFTQASLIAVWACTRPMPSYTRFVAAASGAAWAWFVAVAILPRVAMPSAESAAWAAGLATQAACILAGGSAWSLARHLLGARGKDVDREPSACWFQYSLGSLLVWIAVVAALLGLGQTVSAHLDWNAGVAKWKYFCFLPVMGVFNATYAVLVMLALAGRRLTAARLVIAGGTITVLAYLQPHVLVLLFGETGGLRCTLALLLAGTQTALLYLTIVPVVFFEGCVLDRQPDKTA